MNICGDDKTINGIVVTFPSTLAVAAVTMAAAAMTQQQ
jgi:hypothetical protein